MAKISGGSIGRAMKYAKNDALIMYETIQKVCFSGIKCDGETLVELAEDVAGDEDKWSLFAELICRFARETLPDAKNPREFYMAYEESLKVLNDTVRLNMDKKQAALRVLSSFAGA